MKTFQICSDEREQGSYNSINQLQVPTAYDHCSQVDLFSSARYNWIFYWGEALSECVNANIHGHILEICGVGVACIYSILMRMCVRQRQKVLQPIYQYHLLQYTVPGYRPHRQALTPIIMTTGMPGNQSKLCEPSSGSWLVSQPAACCGMSIFNLSAAMHIEFTPYFPSADYSGMCELFGIRSHAYLDVTLSSLGSCPLLA